MRRNDYWPFHASWYRGPQMPGSSSMFGDDLSKVRMHQGAAAGVGAASAYTAGAEIQFGAGQAGAGAASGRSLLSHELSHVVQQGAARPADIQAAVGHYAK
jgi:hypothetical protein